MPILIREIIPIIDNFSCYYQAFTLKLELIGIMQEINNRIISISIVLLNSHDNNRLNWNDLDAN